ncbi:hypothetical protein MALU111345_06385 [Marinicrinis lubricantis]
MGVGQSLMYPAALVFIMGDSQYSYKLKVIMYNNVVRGKEARRLLAHQCWLVVASCVSRERAVPVSTGAALLLFNQYILGYKRGRNGVRIAVGAVFVTHLGCKRRIFGVKRGSKVFA